VTRGVPTQKTKRVTWKSGLRPAGGGRDSGCSGDKWSPWKSRAGSEEASPGSPSTEHPKWKREATGLEVVFSQTAKLK
jgi:hypothetical protein